MLFEFRVDAAVLSDLSDVFKREVANLLDRSHSLATPGETEMRVQFKHSTYVVDIQPKSLMMLPWFSHL